MHSDSHSPTPAIAVCYFSVTSSHFSVETPGLSPGSEHAAQAFSYPSNPLLANRQLPLHHNLSPDVMDASRLLQLQTAAAHGRPAVRPLQSVSPSSSDSDPSPSSDSSSSQGVCCSRCRRDSIGGNGMVKFGTSSYYCSHCAKMVGYAAG